MIFFFMDLASAVVNISEIPSSENVLGLLTSRLGCTEGETNNPSDESNFLDWVI